MTKEVLVLGNGFDIYHGLKTGYGDFIKYTQQEAQSNPSSVCARNPFLQYFREVYEGNGNWIDCELELERVIRSIISILGACNRPGGNRIIIDTEVLTPIVQRVINHFKGYFTQEESVGITYYSVNERYIITGEIFNKNLFLEDLKADWDAVIETLHQFLREKLLNATINVRSAQLKNLKNISYVVTFNYTNLYNLYGINPEFVFAPHGTLDDLNSMVFGMPDAEDINLDYVYFKKYFQRLQKHTGLLRLPDDDGTNETKDVRSYFFGMSMGKADEYYIKRIISHCHQSVIYYYSQKDFEEKVINLIDIYGRKALETYINNERIVFEKLEKAVEI